MTKFAFRISAVAIAIDDLVYWDAKNGLVIKAASKSKQFGYAVTAAPNPSATVNVRLVPVV